MSRWLSQVGAFLEQMDDQAQEIVEETINVEGHGDADANLDSILAQRGLQVASTEDDDLDDLDEALAAMDQDEDPNSSNAATAGEAESSGVEDTGKGEEHQVPEPQIMEESTNPKEASMTERPQVNDDDQSGQVSSEESNKVGDSNNPEASDESAEGPDSNDQKEKEELSTEDDKDATKTADDNTHKSNAQAVPPPAPDAKAETQASKEAPEKVAPKKVPPPPAPKQKAAPPPPPKAPPAAPSSAPSAAPVVVTKDPNPALVKEAREAQKEVRTLRRHVVALNKQLESVEEEVSAQRKELDQTGGIMEKERAKAKLERDNERKRHAEEMKATQEQHEKTLMEQKTQMEQQMAELSHRLNDMEHTRMQEGGNWDKELQGSVEREQILGQKLASLEDEKETFLAQIRTLQSQQEALGDRIESLSQTADSAMEREREAEERLDQALSVHAHQISQRQNRERELERQLAEMGSAMAALRSKESNRLSSDYSKTGSDISDTAGENTSQSSSLRMRLDMALHDLETNQANLELERQRTEALQRELKEMSDERTEEAANARMKQNKHDRQVAELTLQLSRIQQQPAAETGSSRDLKDSSSNKNAEVHELKSQIKELSEEILKSREKMGGYSSEIATLRSRLKGANDRADKAERDLEDAMAVESTDSYDRMERAVPQGGSSMRRRGAGRARSGGTASISSAMHLNKTEKVAKAVDALDSFSVSTGKYLRVNPVARAAFIMYLIILHLWTFVIIFFHAHNFEDIHRDAADLPHGPDALMQKQLGAGGQAVAAAVAAAKAAADAQKKAP